VDGVLSSSGRHSVSDIIDSHCQRQRQATTSQHVSTMPTDNARQSHDTVDLLAVTHHPRPPTKPPPGNENDGNCLNLLHLISPQPWQHGTSADVQQLREPSKPAGRSAAFVRHASDTLHRAEPLDELRADNGRWVKPVDSELDWIFAQHAGTLPHTSDSTDRSVRQPLCELVSSCLPQSGQRELVTGRHLAADSVSMIPTAVTGTSARSRDLFYSTPLESTGQSLRLC